MENNIYVLKPPTRFQCDPSQPLKPTTVLDLRGSSSGASRLVHLVDDAITPGMPRHQEKVCLLTSMCKWTNPIKIMITIILIVYIYRDRYPVLYPPITKRSNETSPIYR